MFSNYFVEFGGVYFNDIFWSKVHGTRKDKTINKIMNQTKIQKIRPNHNDAVQ